MREQRTIAKAIFALFLLAMASLPSAVTARELRGTVSSVEPSGRIRIELPGGAVARPGDEVRIGTIVRGPRRRGPHDRDQGPTPGNRLVVYRVLRTGAKDDHRHGGR